MRGFFNGLVIGIILGAVGFWFVQKKAREHPEAQQRYEQSTAQLRTNAAEVAENMSAALRAKLDTLDLHTDKIKDELARTGKIFRSKTQGASEKVADAASDARAVTEIKAKYAEDSTLSAWKISVGCHQGHVMLFGAVSSPEDIGKAVALALDADGVHDVTSKLEVKPK
ncbi:MAG TPA: BON domain-containing protein, partial [Verrucomicrobiae bacterium]|nr:BON domain-containing protein [Verrucomicrobiae bacterium]